MGPIVVLQLHLETDLVQQVQPVVPVLVETMEPLGAVLKLLQETDDGCVLVQQNQRLVGIFTERDAVRLMMDGTDLSTPVESLMVSKVVTVQQDDTVQTALTRMSAGGYRRLPVVDTEQHPVGLLKVTDVLHYLVEHVPSTVYNLPPTPHHTTQEREGA